MVRDNDHHASFLDGYRLGGNGEPIALGQTETLANERLKSVARRQRVVANSGRFGGFKDPLSKFPTDIEYQLLMKKLTDLLARSPNLPSEKRRGLVGSFEGELLERIAYLYLSAKFLGNKIILPPEDTVRIFSALNPSQTINRRGMQLGLANVSTPDMIATNMEGTQITDIYEVAMNPLMKIETGQLDRFAEVSERTGIFLGSQVTLVHPDIGKHEALDLVSGRVELPFTYSQFRDFAAVMETDAERSVGTIGLDKGVEISL